MIHRRFTPVLLSFMSIQVYSLIHSLLDFFVSSDDCMMYSPWSILAFFNFIISKHLILGGFIVHKKNLIYKL